MKESTGYIHEGKEEEVARLEFQANADEDNLDHEFNLLHLRPGLKVLDAGCGTGAVTRRIARKIAPSNATGVDRDDFFIAKAKEFATNEEIKNVQFKVGDITDLEFSEDFFDVSFCRLVLMHVQDPVKAVSELRRVTKSGGIVAASDFDDGTLLFHPAIPKAIEFSNKCTEWMKEKGVDRFIGRRLFSIFKQAGLKSIRIIAIPVIITYENQEAISAFGANVFQSFEQIKDILIEQGIIASKEIEEVYQEYEEFTRNPGAFLMFTTFLGIGEVP